MKSLQRFFYAETRHKFGRRHDALFHGFGHRPGGLGGRWGGRTRRGEGKFLVLEALLAGPRHGYEVMSAIEEKHAFRPSPGSIYPTLEMLDDAGFVTSSESDGKRVYTITDSGRELLAGHPTDRSDDEPADARHRARQSASKLMAAIMSARGSDDATLDKLREVIDRARREIYAILAADQT